ncbi:MAG: hypothetical protein GY835_02175 [bacterium]|nr:hypothetical protein [bacterium]
MYIVSHDLIVSTYSAHLHELAHLLINYRLGTPHLYTHTLLLEGFAVAVGGRGGKAPEILHELGVFLHRSGWITHEELLDQKTLIQLNASMSYPGSAPYNRFLIDCMGMESYLDLYMDFGGSADRVAQLQIPAAMLPNKERWLAYLDAQPSHSAIVPADDIDESVTRPAIFIPDRSGVRYGFILPEITVLRDALDESEHVSILFEELVSDRTYSGGRYLFRCSQSEVGLYDLHTNTMIAHYAASFTESANEVPEVDGYFAFYVDREVFDQGGDVVGYSILAE